MLLREPYGCTAGAAYALSYSKPYLLKFIKAEVL